MKARPHQMPVGSFRTISNRSRPAGRQRAQHGDRQRIALRQERRRDKIGAAPYGRRNRGHQHIAGIARIYLHIKNLYFKINS